MKKLIAAILVAAAPLFLAPQASAQVQDARGFVDITQVESWFSDEPTIEVNIRGALLNLVAEASRFEDPELADMLRRLKAIQVRGFDLSGVNDDLLRRSGDLGRSLESKGWETIVRVRDDGDYVQMYLLADGDVIEGMVVLAVDEYDDEAMFVNIVGEIRPDQIGRIGRKFNIGALEDR